MGPLESLRPQSHDAQIEVFKFIRNELHFCTYIDLLKRLVNLFVELAECAPGPGGDQELEHVTI